MRFHFRFDRRHVERALHSFTAWTMIFMGRILRIVGPLALIQQIVVNRELAVALIAGLLYGGGLFGLGVVLRRMGRLALGLEG